MIARVLIRRLWSGALAYGERIGLSLKALFHRHEPWSAPIVALQADS